MMNNAFTQALAAALALAPEDRINLIQVLIAMGQASGSAPAPVQQASAPAPAPVKERTLAPAEDVELPITPVKVGRGKVAFLLGFGAGKAGAKELIKDAGFAWDSSLADDSRHGAWVGTTAQAKAIGITASSKTLTVPAKWVQAGRDKAAAKAARKAAKAQ